MSYIYHLAGENLELAKRELEGFLRSQEVDEIPEEKCRICLTEAEPSQLRRLGLTHEVSKFIEERNDLDINYRPESSFAVRAHNFTEEKDKKEIEDTLGSILETSENKVDLENPDEVVNVYIFQNKYIFGTSVEKIDRGLFKQRENQKRPFSSPISMDPVLGRVLVNLSEVQAGEKILDPFCGTGGILIEAGLCGILPVGTDIQEKMVKGTKQNLEEFGVINYDISQNSISEITEEFDKKFDGIITDLPYGKASKSEGKPIKKFLETSKTLNKGKTVFMYNEEKVEGYQAELEVYVHQSLTRYIFII